MEKTCITCGETKPVEMFRKGGNQCKACRAAQRKAYYEANREKELARKKARQVSKAAMRPIVNRLMVQQRGKCAVCHADILANFHVDHILPLALGGTHDEKNLQLLCPSCNLKKHAKHPVEFMQQQGKLL